MTDHSSIEDRVRQTLTTVAAQPLPPAPLGFNSAAGSAGRRPVKSLSVALVVGAVVVAVVLALIYGPHSGGGGTPRPGSVPTTSHRDPANFVMVDSGDLEIESAKTGQLVKNLGPIANYTNNGFALSPDGRYAYATITANRSTAIERIDLTNGQPTPFAAGEQPSVSQDGRFVAFGAGSLSADLSIRDLKTGTTRSINLRKLLGPQTDLLNASITWLGNGSQVVVNPGGVGNDLMPGTTTTTPLSGSCSALSISQTCLIVVSTSVGHSLSARRVVLNGLRTSQFVVAASGTTDLVLASYFASHSLVYKVVLSSDSASFSRLFSLPRALPVAFDRQGTELFYLKGHGPALWVAEVTPHGLERSRMLNAHAALEGLAS
jgi:hypothetical protein